MHRYKRNNCIRISPLFLLIFSMFIVQCSRDIAGGFASETTNGITITGIVLSQNGSPAKNVSIFIRTTNFLKDTTNINAKPIPDAQTDSLGRFVIDSIDIGHYTIEITDRVEYAELVELNTINFNTTIITLKEIRLKRIAGFYGIVDRENITESENVYVQIYGLDRGQKVDSKGNFYFNKIPYGTHKIRLISSNTNHGIVDSDTVDIDTAEIRDAGTYLLPFEFFRDTLIVREILDSNYLYMIPVKSVVEIKKGRIVALSLEKKDLFMLPPSIKKLRLKRLSLAHNKLDTIPKEIGFIRTLDKLIIKDNVLTKLPRSMDKLTHMKHLDLSNNQLSSLPKNITQLKKIHSLYVAHNKLLDVPQDIKIWLDKYSTDIPYWKSTQGTEE